MEKYSEKIYREIPITDKRSIKVSVSEHLSDGNKLVDIRQFILYHDHTQADDGIKRFTPKGIKLRIENIPVIISGLAEIYQDECGVEPIELFTSILKDLY